MVNVFKDIYFRHLMRRAASRVVGFDRSAAMRLAQGEFIGIDPGTGELAAGLVAKALWDAAGGRFSPEELDWIGRIEAIRSELCASSAEVDQPDWGATSGVGDTPAVISRQVGEVCRSASKPKLWSGLLLRLVREFRPRFCLEMGTCLGISACYQGAGLQMNGTGRLVTLEGAPEFAEIARKNFARVGLSNVRVITGPFEKTLDGALDDLGGVDYAFIDGHHQEGPTIEYFGKISARANRGAVLIFDDINWSDGMKRAWRTVSTSPGVWHPMNLHTLGVCLYGQH